jgi:hypothetical protein
VLAPDVGASDVVDRNEVRPAVNLLPAVHHVTVKQFQFESLRACLARAVLLSSRTPTLNPELGQHAQRSALNSGVRFAGGPRLPIKPQSRAGTTLE